MRTLETPGIGAGLDAAPRIVPTALEAKIFELSYMLEEWVVPRENLLRSPTATLGLKVQGKVAGSVWEAETLDTKMSLSGGKAGIELFGAAGGRMKSTAFALPEEYTIVAVAKPDVVNTTQMLLAEAGNLLDEGVLSLYLTSTGNLRLQHGSGALGEAAGITTTGSTAIRSIYYASWHPGTLTCALGINRLDPSDTNTITLPHNSPDTTFVGSTNSAASTQFFDGVVFDWLVFDRAMHLPIYDNARRYLIQALADEYGVTVL